MEMQGERARYERSHDPSRVLALSDGVIAIVITLLVLEIHVPELTSGQSLSEALDELRPSLVAFLISFVVVAISWAGHRELFAMIQRVDRSLLWLNVAYLLPLSLVPFGAALISRYDRSPVALELYGVLLVTIALMRLWVWLYATKRPHLMFEPVGRRTRRAGVAIVVVPTAFYVLAIALAEGRPTTSLVIYILAPVVYFVGVFVERSTAPPGAPERDFT
jgi:uncharacterized membrane protein